MNVRLEEFEKALLDHSAKGELYPFTRTVNEIPAEYAKLINPSVLKRVAENLQNMHASNDARSAVYNVYLSKFNH